MTMTMIEALPRVDIGPWHALESAIDDYTHAVVAFPGRVDIPQGSRLEVLQVDVEDVDGSLIIEYFEPVSRFLRDALGSGERSRVAVVCAQGVSRSSTLVLAAMMTGEARGLDAPGALEKLREVYPQACPNDGFMEQLRLWKEMGCRLDMGNATYRSLRARQAAQDVANGLDGVRLRDVDDVDAFDRVEDKDRVEDVERVDRVGTATEAGSSGPEPSETTSYRCRSCRRMLATSENVMVDVSLGGEGFTWRKIRKNMAQDTGARASDTSSIFVEPLSWMAGIHEQAQGKIYCPNGACKARLGSFNWSGMQDAEGRWMTPAFNLHLAKMDVGGANREAATDATIRIRQPKFGNPTSAAAAVDPQPSRVVIFDCDGVLVDSERASCEALRRAILDVTEFDIPHDFPDDFVPVFGMDVRSCLEYYMEAYDQEEAFRNAADAASDASADASAASADWMAALADRVAASKGPHYESITKLGIDPIPGAGRLMREATAAVPTAIASSGSHAKIRHNLSSAGLWNIVPVHAIVSAQDVPRGKPAPDVYLKALDVLDATGAPAKDAIVIEDSIHGMHAAIRAGVGYVAAMTTSLNETQLVESLRALRDREGTGVGDNDDDDDDDNDDDDRGGRDVVVGRTRCVVIGSTLPPLHGLFQRLGLE